MACFDQSNDGEDRIAEFNLNQRRTASVFVVESADGEAFGLLSERDEIVHQIGPSVTTDQVWNTES